MTARSTFETELEQLNLDLIKMGGMIEEAIAKSIGALETSDTNIANEIISADRTVDDMEKQIEARCLRLLMRQQPVARDLRAISTALKMITDMERIGDHAADIAELTIRLDSNKPLSMAQHIPEMADIATQMVRACVKSFIDNNLEQAKETIARDDEVDDLFNVVRDELIKTLSGESDAEKANQAIDLMMIAKYLERIGDHAVNICEWVVFYDTGLHKQTQIM
ncbi:PhoU-like phosphate uptake regulator [Hydrogenoanaerobacterium saccharovorans]|uniref:Phosphate-specific transport system accessory protein PhoU n=1 Tax=Hydrogenoanaerobacterium saccharovorans TaxID=474960 RepID=A0A1H8CQJ7_9FIRM|nr:phosphate signaling complex protein PhoU [Hydrogenoanaerobacterium saccharovorans]RPF43226.1 PhoU-like phosphate uptake regulator [Hydrogenoanaerobacterium saccharovorans]SEM96568.1 phosphate uptake regulator, PhoU [Hydrogenoanaerobacterium saccharovorans]